MAKDVQACLQSILQQQGGLTGARRAGGLCQDACTAAVRQLQRGEPQPRLTAWRADALPRCRRGRSCGEAVGNDQGGAVCEGHLELSATAHLRLVTGRSCC